MGYTDGLLASPYASLFLVAVPVALLLRTGLLLIVRRNAPQRTRDRRLTLVFIFAAFAVGALAVMVIAHGIGFLVASEALVFFTITVVVLSAGFVFVRVVGIPLLFIASVFLVMGAYMTRPWQPVAGAEARELAVVTVLSSAEETMRLEVSPYPGEPTGEDIVRLPGNRFAVTVEMVSYHPYWFFLGRSLGARVENVTSVDENGGGEAETRALPDPCEDGLCRLIRSSMDTVPGIDVRREETAAVEAETLVEYAVLMSEAGEVEIKTR
ncbi:MAG: hypothetical protein R6V29_08945 [Spirochaetia bacterium]